MSRFSKIGLILVATVSIAFIGMLGWFRVVRYHSTELSRSFYSALSASNRTLLDLRNLDAVEWDELVFWSPYKTLCDYGIDGFAKGTSGCPRSTDDGECYLVFLKANHVTGKVPIDRKKIDLAASKLPQRIPRNKAIFSFQTRSDWPEVSLAD